MCWNIVGGLPGGGTDGRSVFDSTAATICPNTAKPRCFAQEIDLATRKFYFAFRSVVHVTTKARHSAAAAVGRRQLIENSSENEWHIIHYAMRGWLLLLLLLFLASPHMRMDR